VTALVNWAKDSLRVSDGSLIILIFAVGTVLLYLRPRLGRRWLTAAVLGFLFVSTPLGNRILIAPLVTGFHSIQDPAEAQSAGAIVVLGGGIRDTKAGADVFAYPVDGTTLRVLEGARVFRLLGSRVPVVASGGFTQAGRRIAEATVMADVLAAVGVPRDHILVENQSRNTHDQAVEVTRMLRARGIDRFVLVTSPTHIRRSMMVFRAQTAGVVPSPAALFPDYTAEHYFFMPNFESLRISDEAVYDYAGMAYYWWRGWLGTAAKAPR
jgi:uncharacterized SAM-binding protein YcdF (DUF218 family)